VHAKLALCLFVCLPREKVVIIRSSIVQFGAIKTGHVDIERLMWHCSTVSNSTPHRDVIVDAQEYDYERTCSSYAR
jgi:hypothetical protein